MHPKCRLYIKQKEVSCITYKQVAHPPLIHISAHRENEFFTRCSDRVFIGTQDLVFEYSMIQDEWDQIIREGAASLLDSMGANKIHSCSIGSQIVFLDVIPYDAGIHCYLLNPNAYPHSFSWIRCPTKLPYGVGNEPSVVDTDKESIMLVSHKRIWTKGDSVNNVYKGVLTHDKKDIKWEALRSSIPSLTDFIIFKMMHLVFL